jgi:hypothetical protein
VYELVGATPVKADGGKLSYRAVRSRLLLMFEAGYLLRTPIMPDESVIRRAPAAEYSYRLSKHGANIATGGKFLGELSPTSANHDKNLTELHTALDNFPGKVIWEQRHMKRTVNPDAMFGLSKDGKTGHFFFLEYERSRANHYTEPGVSGLVKKVKKYDDYRMGKLKRKVREDWKLFDDFRVIFIVKNNDRKPQARKRNLLKKLVEQNLAFRRIWVATDKEFLADPMGKVFHTPADFSERSYSLLDL